MPKYNLTLCWNMWKWCKVSPSGSLIYQIRGPCHCYHCAQFILAHFNKNGWPCSPAGRSPWCVMIGLLPAAYERVSHWLRPADEKLLKSNCLCLAHRIRSCSSSTISALAAASSCHAAPTSTTRSQSSSGYDGFNQQLRLFLSKQSLPFKALGVPCEVALFTSSDSHLVYMKVLLKNSLCFCCRRQLSF